jgi:hypothetical protein
LLGTIPTVKVLGVVGLDAVTDAQGTFTEPVTDSEPLVELALSIMPSGDARSAEIDLKFRPCGEKFACGDVLTLTMT